MIDILIFSTTPKLAKLLGMVLTREGYSWQLSYAAEQRIALSRLIILLDLPTELILKVLCRGDFRAPIFALSHDHSTSRAELLFERGVDQYMTLPITIERLRDKLALGLNSNIEGLCRGL